MRRAGPVIVALAATLYASSAVAADSNELEKLRGAIEESRLRVGGHEREERELLLRLEQHDRLSLALEREVKRARSDADDARAAAFLLERESAEASERLEQTRRAMSRRVVALYKAGEVGPVRFLFASTTVPELMSRVSALQSFVEYDAELVSLYRRSRDELERLRAEARSAATTRDEAAARLEARSAELAVERGVRRRLLARVREDRSAERRLLVELEKAARALEATISALGDAPASDAEWLVGQGFAERRGRLERPLASHIEQPFGRVVDEIFRTETLRKGVEFAASGGESVRAVAPGVVRFAGWFRGYGKLVIVDQGDQYFTVVSHLGELFVEVGDTTGEGDTLGTVGETGSLTGPSLYFEIRHGSEPLDPADWLRPSSVYAEQDARSSR